ncbi:hypothetical protein AB0B12_15700 [Streptomyces sp. NPDC044780]|uniref:hypothetical protein n=1 Tax=unclassified Streptomyces TaxID=2593676 RepID=UPI0022A85824|nr:hypothetical protein [Streptomyces sp. S465]WAP54277.1 hypothetical protein N6H00_04425 [Streptomyces sp. S465]
MLTSVVRGAVATAAMTTVLALLPAAAQAAAAGNTEKVNLLGVAVSDTKPKRVQPGDRWETRLKLYTEKKKTYAGDGTVRCDTVRVTGSTVVVRCARVLHLKKKGWLVLSDKVTHKGDKTATATTRIVGGTGRYNSAYGKGTVTLAGPLVHFALKVGR